MNINFIQQFAQLAPNQKGKMGVDNCKDLILYFAEVIPKLQDIFSDKKVTFWEALGLSPLLVQGTRLLANFKAVAQEIQDLDQDESQQLISELSQNGIFRKDTQADIENRLRHFVDAVYHIIGIIESAQSFIKNEPHANSQKFGAENLNKIDERVAVVSPNGKKYFVVNVNSLEAKELASLNNLTMTKFFGVLDLLVLANTAHEAIYLVKLAFNELRSQKFD